MARPKKPKPPPPPNKRLLVERLVEKPATGVIEWLKAEYCILKKLEAIFPLVFINQLKFSKKLPSLAVLFCDWQMKDLNNRYRAYCFTPKDGETIFLGEKSGDDIKIEKKLNLREFLT